MTSGEAPRSHVRRFVWVLLGPSLLLQCLRLSVLGVAAVVPITTRTTSRTTSSI
jgi:hypothetical protein